MADDVELNMKPLEQILKALKSNKVTAKVGILGSHDSRSGPGINSNATIGAIHEFGSSKVPQRSFLQMPLTDHLPKKLNNSNLFSDAQVNEIIKTADIKPWVEKIAIMGVATVMEAFDTRGFGTWPDNADSTKAAKMRKWNASQVLVETQQLRDSINYEVK